jgi:hypothetical protein
MAALMLGLEPVVSDTYAPYRASVEATPAV